MNICGKSWIRLVFSMMIFVMGGAGCAQAASYVSSPEVFGWVDPSAHARIAWSNPTQGKGGCDTRGDDSITAPLNIGFTFNFGGVNYTQLRVMTNGRLQFNNNQCGAGTQNIMPRTYTLPYPNAQLNNTMKVYGADIDTSPNGSGGGPGPTRCPSATCYVSYTASPMGTAPNRQYVVTWVNTPDWGSSGSYFNLQVILNENGSFVYQYGPSNNPDGGKADIGWQVTTADYGLIQFANIGSLNATAVKFAPYVPTGVLGVFNAFDTRTPPGSATGMIQTKISGQAFNLDIVALKNNGTPDTKYKGSVLVELVDASGGGACAALPLSQSLGMWTFQKNDNGRLAVTNIQFADARKNLQVRLTESSGKGNNKKNNKGNNQGNNTRIACSTDNFAIRPAYFQTAVTDADWQTPGNTRVLNNVMAAGGVVHKAGQPFRVTGVAVNAAGAVTGGYQNSTPALAATAVLLPAGGALGTLSATAWGVANGVATSNGVTYSEVGAVALQMTDTFFTAVDAADGTPPCQREIGSRCDAGNNPVPWVQATQAGRFVPDHFVLTPDNTPQFKTFNDATCMVRSFTYIGQAFGYVTSPQVLITATNATGMTTVNYRGGLWKIAASNVTQTYNPVSPASPALDTGLVGVPVLTVNNNGTGIATVRASDLLAFIRPPATPQSPFNASIRLNMDATDSAESGVQGNGTITSSGPAVFNGSGSGIAFDSGNAFRYGRLKSGNAHGSELLNLPLPMEAQYWNGVAFITNTEDNCTRLTATHLTLGNYKKNLAACEAVISITGRFNAGKSNLKLIKPGAGNNGSVDWTVNLGATATGNSCAPASTAATAANQSYLQGKWTGSLYDQNPRARASFGIYKNSNDFIYIREMY